jgi:hypothetical protein
MTRACRRIDNWDHAPLRAADGHRANSTHRRLKKYVRRTPRDATSWLRKRRRVPHRQWRFAAVYSSNGLDSELNQTVPAQGRAVKYGGFTERFMIDRTAAPAENAGASAAHKAPWPPDRFFKTGGWSHACGMRSRRHLNLSCHWVASLPARRPSLNQNRCRMPTAKLLPVLVPEMRSLSKTV